MIVPAESPVTNNEWWIGCHSIPDKSVCAVNNEGGFTVDFLSVSLHRVKFFKCTDIEQLDLSITSRSCDEMTVWAPFTRVDSLLMRVPCTSAGAKLKSGMTDRVLSSLPDLGSQNLTSISLLPLTINPLVGCQSTHRTSHPWPTCQFTSSEQEPPTHHSTAFPPLPP